jgi:hypothetical protein
LEHGLFFSRKTAQHHVSLYLGLPILLIVDTFYSYVNKMCPQFKPWQDQDEKGLDSGSFSLNENNDVQKLVPVEQSLKDPDSTSKAKVNIFSKIPRKHHVILFDYPSTLHSYLLHHWKMLLQQTFVLSLNFLYLLYD